MLESIILESSMIEISELASHPDYLQAKFIICDFNTNKNGVRLNRETIEEWMSTLVGSPLLGKITKKLNKKEDFSSHEMKIVSFKDEDGKTHKKAVFDTSAFGVFVDVAIEEVNNVECIVATARIWKRFENACKIIQERAESLKSSWEIATEKYTTVMEDGLPVKIIDMGRFIGHCCLGSAVPPAYDRTAVLEVAEENENELDIALIQDMRNLDSLDVSDINNIENKEVIEMEDNMENVEQTVATSETEEVSEQQTDNVVVETSTETVEDNDISEVHTENDETEVSALTERDLHRSLNEAFEAPDSNGRCTYGYPVLIFPADNTAWFKEYGAKSELDLIEVKYTVENSQVKITERNPVTLTISPREINQVVAQKDNAIVEMSAQIQTLNDKVAELQPYKTKVDEIEKAEREAQLENDKKELSNYALSSGHITQEELETSEEIKGYIEALDKASIKSLIADRVVASLANKETQEVNTSASVENNEAESNIQVNLSAEKVDKKDDSYAINAIRAYIGR